MDEEDEWAGVGMYACPRCLVFLKVDGTPDAPYLRCPQCKMIRLSA
jgi:hypothetical protein